MQRAAPNAPSNRPGYHSSLIWVQPDGAGATYAELVAGDCRFSVWFSRYDAERCGPTWIGSLQRVDTHDVWWLAALDALTPEGAQQECLSRAAGYLQQLALDVSRLVEV